MPWEWQKQGSERGGEGMRGSERKGKENTEGQKLTSTFHVLNQEVD